MSSEMPDGIVFSFNLVADLPVNVILCTKLQHKEKH